jgi:CRP-like cAMP-binding protein
VKLSAIHKGRENILFVLGPNDPFPLGPYFLQAVKGTVYTALTDVRAAWRPRAEMDKFLLRHPDAMRGIMNRLLRAFYARVTTLSLVGSDERVLLGLIELSERFRDGTGDMVELEITQQELADSINLSRESTSLILNKLAQAGIVELYRNKIAVNRVKAEASAG